MPAAVSNNAVASLKGGFQLFSLMGVGSKKNWDDVTNQVYIMTVTRTGKWTTGRSVPGPAGRLNAAAGGAKGLVVLMGGYVVDNQGMETTVPDVNVYEPGARRWSRGKDIPVAVDSAVAGRDPRSVRLFDRRPVGWRPGEPMCKFTTSKKIPGVRLRRSPVHPPSAWRAE